MIKVKHLNKVYGKKKEVIKDLNIEFKETGFNIVVGKSGCGKTTLINILGGMDLDYKGEVIAYNKVLNKLKYHDIADYRNFTSAFIFQINSLFEFMTVEENLKLCLDIQNNHSNISEVLEKVGLKGFEKKNVKSLSGGEKQRVAIARSLIKESKVIFADEPTSALDSKNAHKIFQLFKEISKDRAVIMVTHDVKKAKMYADRMIILKDGNIEDDIVYNEVDDRVSSFKERKSRPFALKPILKHTLKTGLIINLFVMLLFIAGLTITNIAMEADKVKKEYDYFQTENQLPFNNDRAIQTQINNNIDMFRIIKKGKADNPYYYLEHGDKGNEELDEVDYRILKNKFNNYDLYEGASNVNSKELLIDKISLTHKVSIKSGGETYIWKRKDRTKYEYFVYDKDNKYDLVAGRLPSKDNEILVTDTVADIYLRKRARNTGVFHENYFKTYIPSYNELFTDTYSLERKDGTGKDEFPNEMVIFDDYGEVVGSIGGKYNYYISNENKYKIVGVIETNTLPFYSYSYAQERYFLLDNFVTQKKEDYMNSREYQPYGYVVLPKHLGGRVENQYQFNGFDFDSIEYDGTKINTQVKSIASKYDYTGEGLVGFKNNLKIDHDHQILTTYTTKDNLEGNEVLVSLRLLNKIFPDIYMNSSNLGIHRNKIENKNITLTFQSYKSRVSNTYRIVGVTDNSSTDVFFSQEQYSNLYKEAHNIVPRMSINLKGKSLSERKNLYQNLYKYGLSITQSPKMPGGHLEFVDGKGEMIAKVDLDGLISLYPSYQIKDEEGKKVFYVDDVAFGNVEKQFVLMKSTMIKKILLDDSYYTTQGNISPYYLYSDYYNTDKTEKGNSILTIIDGLYKFFLIVAIVLGFGFIYLKESRQSQTVTKLSMLGVRTKDLISVNLITYIPMAIVIGVISFFSSHFFYSVINKLFNYSFDSYAHDASFVDELLRDANGNLVKSTATINRIRIMPTTSTINITIIATIIIMAVMIISSVLVTVKSRKRK